jgi:hypothetical protein
MVVYLDLVILKLLVSGVWKVIIFTGKYLIFAGDQVSVNLITQVL